MKYVLDASTAIRWVITSPTNAKAQYPFVRSIATF
jgi:hypothetical protein